MANLVCAVIVAFFIFGNVNCAPINNIDNFFDEVSGIFDDIFGESFFPKGFPFFSNIFDDEAESPDIVYGKDLMNMDNITSLDMSSSSSAINEKNDIVYDADHTNSSESSSSDDSGTVTGRAGPNDSIQYGYQYKPNRAGNGYGFRANAFVVGPGMTSGSVSGASVLHNVFEYDKIPFDSSSDSS